MSKKEQAISLQLSPYELFTLTKAMEFKSKTAKALGADIDEADVQLTEKLKSYLLSCK